MLMYPIFITDDPDANDVIPTLPGQRRWGVNKLEGFLGPLVQKGLQSVILFGVPFKCVKVYLLVLPFLFIAGLKLFLFRTIEALPQMMNLDPSFWLSRNFAPCIRLSTLPATSVFVSILITVIAVCYTQTVLSILLPRWTASRKWPLTMPKPVRTALLLVT